jgi:hypothetical protein
MSYTTAKIVTIMVPQPPVMQMVQQPDKEEKFVELRLTMKDAKTLRALSGKECGSPLENGRCSLEVIFSALSAAGVTSDERYIDYRPAVHPTNSRAWSWQKAP